MINLNDIGKQFLDTRDPSRTPVTLIALDFWKGAQRAAVRIPGKPNPHSPPGLDEYWLRADLLTPLTTAN